LQSIFYICFISAIWRKHRIIVFESGLFV